MTEKQRVVTGTLVRSVRRVTVKGPRVVVDRMPPFRDQGECGGSEPDLFYPASGSGLGIQDAFNAQVEEAKAICRRCPVIVPCREWALGNEKFGIWGGMTEQERDDLLHPKVRRRNQKARRPAKNRASASGLAAPAEGAQGAAAAAGGRA